MPETTSGPWTTRRAVKPDNTGGYDWAILDPDGKIIAEAFEHVDTGVARPAEANAHLIAAAPDLLASLHGVLQLIGNGQLRRNTSEDANPDWAMRQLPFLLALKRATGAIEKAKGVSPISEFIAEQTALERLLG